MKKIFNWMREQIEEHLNHCKQMAEQSRYFSEEIGYCSRADAYEIALELINEAEAKWEAECCEWKLYGKKEFIENPHTKRMFSNEPSMKNVYCNTCGKPIKISEVE